MADRTVVLPTVRAAFDEARQREFQRAWTPVVYNARMEVGVSRLLQSAENEIWPVFRKHYERMCLLAINGQPLPHKCYARIDSVPEGAPGQVPEPRMSVSSDRSVGREFLKQLKQQLESKQ